MKRANEDIRKYAKCRGVYLWQIADAMGMLDSNFSKLLRYEFDDADKKTIMSIIDGIAEKE